MSDEAETEPTLDGDVRETILSRPAAVIRDPDLMRALVDAGEAARGANIVDLRGIAMDRLEDRLSRLERTHESVIAAAYENIAGTNQIHRAILRLLDPIDFDGFLEALSGDVTDILRVGKIRLVLETAEDRGSAALSRVGGVLAVAEPGFIEDYLTRGRGGSTRRVTLREVKRGEGGLYGQNADWVRSEACLKLDFGPERFPGLLALAADDAELFQPNQGSDLLDFLAGVFERAMRRWLR